MRLAALAALTVLACSRPQEPGRTDLAAVRGLSWVGTGRAPVSHADGWSVPADTGRPAMRAVADRPSVRLGEGDAWVELSHEGGKGRVDGGKLVFHHTRGDIVWAWSPSVVEELHVLRTSSSSEAETLTAGPEVSSITVEDGRIVVRDRANRAVLHTASAWVEDARGVRRAVVPVITGSLPSMKLELTWNGEGLEAPLVVDPAWTKVAPMKIARRNPRVAALTDGRVLVVGGEIEGVAYTYEIYDPVANTWTSGTTSNRYGVESGSARLASGKVLTLSYETSIAELYDPTANTWSSTGAIKTVRTAPVVIALPDGRAVVAGGSVPSTNTAISTVEIFDPATKAFTVAASLATARNGATGHLLSSGKVMVEGGWSCVACDLSSTEIYDPSTNTWSAGAPMKNAHFQGAAITLGDGRLAVVGQSPGLVDVFDGTSWTSGTGVSGNTGAGAPLGTTRGLFAGNTVCISCPSDGPFILDGTSLVAPPPSLVTHRAGAAVAPLPGGKVLLAGGDGVDGPLTTAEIFAPLALGEACPDTGSCAAGLSCVDGVCCSSPSCATGQTCAGSGSKGTCKTRNGLSCTTNANCGSAFCVDGLCCDRACTGQCEACDVAGSAGTCIPATGAPHGTRAACVAKPTACGLACDGVDATKCNYASKATPCSKDGCSAGVETHAKLCDGAGACTDVAKSCGAFSCGALACNTTCATSADCAVGFGCKSNLCVPTVGLGVACGAATECSSGFCVDGVCCAVAGCGVGSVCNLTGKSGTCQKTLGAVCATDAECGVGTCVDGVCCDSACTGACEACDVAGKEGTCSPVLGAPHGSRAACPSGDVCAGRTCDGKDRTTCAGYAKGHETACADASCDGNSFVATSHCDGAGACAAPTKTSCAPFVCEKTGCKTSCTADTDCLSAFQCVSGRCVDASARCTPDKLSSQASDGRVASCAPYVCGNAGTCSSTCISTDECAPGFACAAGACTAPSAASAADQGGGGCAFDPRPAGSGALLLLFVAALLVRRRSALAVLGLVSCSTQASERGTPAPVTSAPPLEAHDWKPAGSPVPTSVMTPIAVAQTDGTALLFGLNDTAAKSVVRIGGTPVTFSTVGSQLVARTVPLAARLSSGKVLVAGGLDSSFVALSTTEIFDPATGTSIAGPTMAVARAGASGAVTLAGGDVLLAGGTPAASSILVVERYSATTGLLTTTTMPVSVQGAVLVLLTSGKVLMIPSGSGEGPTTAIFDPATNTWAAGPNMIGSPRQDVHAVRLTSGKVLIAGASPAWSFSSIAELYDPATNTIKAAATLPARVWAPILSVLPSGRVLLAGGSGYSDFRKDTLVYDPVGDAWLSASPLSNTYNTPGGTTLSDGRALIVGSGPAEVFTEGDVGAHCTQSGDCKNLHCVDNVCCGTASCPAGSTCAPGGTCKLANGTACASAAACGSGNCVDGVCCDTACTGQCAACNVAGKVGTCSGFVGVPRGGRPACTGAGLGTACGAACDGVTTATCSFAPSGTTCGADTCLAGIETRTSTCNGSGGCGDASHACAPYVCGATSCKTTCAGSTDCAPGAFCKGTACVPVEGLGSACSASSECASGACVDGVCCSTASCPAGQICNDPSRKGTCAKAVGSPCAVSAECASDHCVDGACCDTACDGTCEACDVTGKVGTCTPIDGAPHGSRPACDVGDGLCGARTCLGSKDSKGCAGYAATASTQCAPASCAGESFTAVSQCDGAGACVAPKAASCAPYACNGEGCLSSCVIDLDCAKGWVCRKSACVPEGAACTADLLASVDKTGKLVQCAPYKCKTDGTCADTCVSSDDCSGGAVCDTDAKTCSQPPAADSGGGCSASRVGSTGFSWVILAIGLLVRRRLT